MNVLQYVFSYSEHLDEIFLLGIEPLRRGVCCTCSCGIGQALPEDKIQTHDVLFMSIHFGEFP